MAGLEIGGWLRRGGRERFLRRYPLHTSNNRNESVGINLQSGAGIDVVIGLASFQLTVGCENTIAERARPALVNNMQVAEFIDLRLGPAERENGTDGDRPDDMRSTFVSAATEKPKKIIAIVVLLQVILSNLGRAIGRPSQPWHTKILFP